MIHTAPAAFEHAKDVIGFLGTGAEITRDTAHLLARQFPWLAPYYRGIEAVADTFAIASQFFTDRSPGWNIDSVVIDGETVRVTPIVISRRPFADTLYFQCEGKEDRDVPTILIYAPWSGHPPDYVHDTVRTFLPDFHVVVSAWRDPRQVPVTCGDFDLDDKVDYSMNMMREVKPDGVFVICEPCVSVTGGIAKMNALGDPDQPNAAVLAAGPIDPHVNPTKETQIVLDKGVDWLTRNVIRPVPDVYKYPGRGRDVYSHELQIAGFMAKKQDEHFSASLKHVVNIMRGDDDAARRHRNFYYRFLPGMPLPRGFFLQTAHDNFIMRMLARNAMVHRGEKIDMRENRRTAMMVVEGGMDDIAPPGQTIHALELNANAPALEHHLEPEAGHTGVFSGSRFRKAIYPKVRDFFHAHRKPHRGNGMRLKLMAVRASMPQAAAA